MINSTSPGSNEVGADEPRVIKGLVSVLDVLASLCMVVSGTMMVVLIAIFGWLVFGRYVNNDTPTWVEQASLMLIVWITFLGSAVGVWRSSHLSIEFIREMLPERPRLLLRFLTDLLLVVFGAYMAYYGTALTIGMSRRLVPMLGISEAWRAAPLALCGAFIVLFSAARFLVRIVETKRARSSSWA